MFTQELLKKNGIRRCKVYNKFPSKRNQVYLLDLEDFDGNRYQKVFKLHSNKTKLIRETEMLFLLKNSDISVPVIDKVIGNGILMQYVRGPRILDFLEWQEVEHFQYKEPFVKYSLSGIHMLIEWMAKFYEITEHLTGKSLILGNASFKNFIIRYDIFGVSFAEYREGHREEDAGLLCAYALTYDPAYTPWKKKLVQEMVKIMLEKLDLDRPRFASYLNQEIERINKRRGLRMQAAWLQDVTSTITF